MANKDALQNLTRFDPIVNPDGTPTEFFMRILQGSNGITGDITTEVENLQSIEIETEAPIGGGPFVFADHEDDDPPFVISHDAALVVPETYGDATHVPQITVDEFGHVQEIVDIPISGGGGGGGRPLVVPASTDFANTVGVPAISDGTYSMKVSTTVNGGLAGKSNPSPSLPFHADIKVEGTIFTDFNSMGFMIGDTSGKYVTVILVSNGGLKLAIENWNSQSSFNATFASLDLVRGPFPTWLRVDVDASGDVAGYYSFSGDNWIQIGASRSNFLGTVDELGIQSTRSSAINANAFFESYEVNA